MPRSAQPTALLFVDAASPLLAPAQILAKAQILARTELLELAADQDGILQITAILSERTGLNSLHILSSGSGYLQIGTAQLTLFNLDCYGWELQQWGESLAPGAEIILHERPNHLVSQFSDAFLNRLHLLTGARVLLAETQRQPVEVSVGF